jgi:hypothetical protein
VFGAEGIHPFSSPLSFFENRKKLIFMIKSIIEKQLISGNENMSFEDFKYLAQSGETNLIERKSIQLVQKQKTDDLKEKISKSTSAFSNYLGGCILFGVDDKTGTVEDGIENTIQKTTIKEWLEDIVWTSCSPPIQKFTVKKAENNSKYLFAIFIKSSDIAPHQANFGKAAFKYHYRIDGKSKPIDGILVRDIFNRSEFSDLDIIPEIRENSENHSPTRLILDLTLKNISNIPAEKVCVLMKLSQNVINGGLHSQNATFSKDYGQFNSDLVYPDLLHDIVGREKIKLKDFNNELTCSLQIVAKNMRMKKTVYKIQKDKNKFLLMKIK